jgi:integrase
MSTVLLTDRRIASIKPTHTRVEYVDQKVPGLALRVTPNGAESWTVRYRHRGRLRRLTLGDLAVVSLADARARGRDALHNASKGEDPAGDKQTGRRAETVGELAELYLAKWAKPRKRSWKADDNLLRNRVLPQWRSRAIIDIGRHDVRLLVEAIAEGGAPVVANRVAALCSKLFAFALDRDLIKASPAVRIPRPARETARDRVLTEEEIRSLWASFDALDPPMAAFYKLRLVTAQRGGEVVAMRWQDVDLHGGWWTIPAADAKNNLTHRVPLNATALKILQGLKKTAHKDAVFVLAAHHRAKGGGARGKRQQSEAARTFTVPDFRGHDLRRTAASMMASGGISRLTTSKILNPVERTVTAVYDRHSYDAEKAAALRWWNAKLASILAARQSSVRPFSNAPLGRRATTGLRRVV